MPKFSIEDVGGRYNWADGGESLITIFFFEPEVTTSDPFNDYELVQVPIDATNRLALGRFTSIFAYDDFERLTENNFYDDYPDWAP